MSGVGLRAACSTHARQAATGALPSHNAMRNGRRTWQLATSRGKVQRAWMQRRGRALRRSPAARNVPGHSLAACWLLEERPAWGWNSGGGFSSLGTRMCRGRPAPAWDLRIPPFWRCRAVYRTVDTACGAASFVGWLPRGCVSACPASLLDLRGAVARG
jgi:hypothetical protein